MTIVRPEHAIGEDGRPYCNKGMRAFFQRHGLDWREFVKNGLPEEALVKTKDAMALRAVTVAQEKARG